LLSSRPEVAAVLKSSFRHGEIDLDHPAHQIRCQRLEPSASSSPCSAAFNAA
jgi:hypothetical protein